jgi:nucleotide-binding universal stress UspA family protein
LTAFDPPSEIVVPLDGSKLAERAVSVAGSLAARFGAKVVLLTTDWLEVRETALEYLQGVAATLSGVTVETVELGARDVAVAINSFTRTRPGSMICMTTHGRGGFRWALIGSVAEEVVQIAESPVLLVGRRCAPWLPADLRVVMCHDGSADAGELVDVAAGFARAADAPLWIATVMHPLDVESAENPRELFAPVVARLAGTRIESKTWLIRSPYPTGALVDFAEEHSVSMLVMATHGRQGAARVFVGSVTMGVLNNAPCPVLTVRRREA